MGFTKRILALVLALLLMLGLSLTAFADGAAAEDAAETTAETVETVVEDAADAVKDAVEDAVDAVEDTAEDAVDALEETAEDAVEAEQKAENAVADWAKNAFADFGKTKWYVYVIIAALAVLGVIGFAKFGKKSSGAHMSTRILSEGAMMIALATVLSLVKIWEMPFGGSVTLFSMLPLVLMSYRHGTKWGLFTAFVHSLLQLVMGVKNLGYCATLQAQIECILLDYVVAFTVIGLASALSRPVRNRTAGVCFGTAMVCFFRFVCHFLSGILLWGSYKEYYAWAASLPTWLYSLIYNGNYMLPELVITTIGAILLVRGAPRLFDRQKD